MLGDAAAVGEDFPALGVLLGRDIAELFQQRHVNVRFDVAGDSRIAIPVPGTADVGGLVDQPDIVDPELFQSCAYEQSAETGTDNRDVYRIGDGIAGKAGIGPRILTEARERARYFHVLGDPVRTQAPVAFLRVFLAQLSRIEPQPVELSHDPRLPTVRPGRGVPSSSTRRRSLPRVPLQPGPRGTAGRQP
jgi:hypothetical protein